MSHPIFDDNAKFLKISFERKLLFRWSGDIIEWLFCIHPIYSNVQTFLTKEIELKHKLVEFIRQTNLFDNDAEECVECVEAFFKKLPEIHRLLKSDLEASFNSDPAAKSIAEVLMAYPGFHAVVIHRLAHELFLLKVPFIPRLLSEYAHSTTGIDIHPGATIGERFFIDHGTGVVIGESCIIGDDVKIYQGVTLGALSVSRDLASTKRHPSIGDRVIIYSNATILGGNTIIGSDSVIGGNVWITQSLPSHSLVYHKSNIIIKDKNIFPEPLNFTI